MAIEFKSGTTITVKVSRAVSRAAAVKTLERVMRKCKGVSGPIEAREKNFVAIPGRRGGRVWTKHPNKVHAEIIPGLTATIKATPQCIRDLNSVAEFVEVKAKK